MGPDADHSPDARSGLPVDSVLRTISDEHRRAILAYLADSPGRTVDCDEVVEHLLRGETAPVDRDSLELLCRHAHFPRLDESGLVEHDTTDGTLRVVSEPAVEAVVAFADELEE